MGLRDIGSSLPPGFRFYPSDEELVCHYLYKKIANEEVLKGTLVEIDLHTCEPWQLPDVAKLNSNEWYFFNFRDRKYATGFRTNRATASGYWKATGKDRAVLDPRTRIVVGMRKTLVFYKNRAPNGIKSGWIMHEFRLENPHAPPKEDWVLCRVFHKSKCENSYKYTSSNENNFCDTSSADAYVPNAYQSNITSFGSSVPDPAKHGLDPFHHDHMNLEPHHFPISSSSDHTKLVEHTKSTEDDYGFLFDMSFDDSNAMPLSFVEDMRFNKDDSSMFI